MQDEKHIRLAEVGGRIRRAREASGLTLHDLALLSGVSAPALSRIETGHRDLRVSSLFRIAVALRVSPGNLLDEQTSGVVSEESQGGEGYDLQEYA